MNPWLHALQFVIVTGLFTIVTVVAIIVAVEFFKEI